MAGLELSPHLSACSTPHTCHRLPGAHLTEWPLAGTERCLGHGQGRNGMGREAHGATLEAAGWTPFPHQAR